MQMLIVSFIATFFSGFGISTILEDYQNSKASVVSIVGTAVCVTVAIMTNSTLLSWFYK